MFEDLRARNDALSEAKLQVESQKNIERGAKWADEAVRMTCKASSDWQVIWKIAFVNCSYSFGRVIWQIAFNMLRTGVWC